MIPPIKANLIRERGRLEFVRKSVHEETEMAHFHSFWTDCGRYCLTRIDSKLEGLSSDWAACAQEDGRRVLLTRDHRSLGRALQSLLTFHQNRYGFDTMPQTNEEEIEIAAKNSLPELVAAGYDKGTKRQGCDLEDWASKGRAEYQVEFDFHEEEAMLKVSEKSGMDLMKALGLEKTARDKLESRLSKIQEYVGEDVELSKENRRLIESLTKAVADGKAIKVVAAGEKASANGKHGSNGKSKDKAEKSVKVSGPRVKSTAPREGSMIAFVYDCLQKGPVSKEDIVKKTAKKFPDSKPDTVAASVSWYMSSNKGLQKYGIQVKKSSDGLFSAK